MYIRNLYNKCIVLKGYNKYFSVSLCFIFLRFFCFLEIFCENLHIIFNVNHLTLFNFIIIYNSIYDNEYRTVSHGSPQLNVIYTIYYK